MTTADHLDPGINDDDVDLWRHAVETGQLDEPDDEPDHPGLHIVTDPDTEADNLQAEIRFNEQVARRAEWFKIDAAARARVAAEQYAESDFTDLYLDRSQLADLPTPEPLIEHALPRHAYAILSGRDHSFKSFVAIDWACCLATGKPWQGLATEAVRVLYIAGEGAYGITKRIDAWEYAWGRLVDSKMLTVRRSALNLHTPGPAFDELLQRIETDQYGLVIVDTLRRVSGSAKENTSEMGTVIDNLALIKEATTDGTVLAIAHTDKGDNDSRGYSGIEDDADVVWHATRQEMNLTLELTKMKDGPDGRLEFLQAERTAGSIILSGLTSRPTTDTTESQLKILDTLAELFPDGAASTALLKATGLADATYYRAIKQLREQGHVQNIGTARRPHLMRAGELSPPENTEQTDSETSHDLSEPDTPLDLHNSHNSHDLSTDLPLPPTTPTTLRSGSTESDSETSTPKERS